MSEKHLLGIYWGSDAFSLVLTTKFHPVKLLHVPFDTPIGGAEETKDIPEGLKYKALIEQTLSRNGIGEKAISLCLPTKETIFRSFVIPMMNPKEIASVIGFEARKYIPISLEQLSYTFHSVPITEKQQRKLCVLFVATRKAIISRYARILDQAGLQLQNIESAPVCLLRVLQRQGILQAQSHAVAVIDRTSGIIMIATNYIVEFVREFPVSEDRGNQQEWQNKILNDIQVSLNFFSRKSPGTRIHKIITCSIYELPGLSKTLSEELSVPVSVVSPADLLKTESISDLGLLNAYGAASRGYKFSPNNFDLSDQASLRQREGPSALESMDYKKIVLTTALCAAVIASTFFLTNKWLTHKKNRLTELQTQQGKYSGLKSEDLTAMEEEISKKLQNYQSIQLNSNINFYLVRVAQFLPEGAWLDSLQMIYKTERQEQDGEETPSKRSLSITMQGYAYHPDLNKQFDIVNVFLENMKNAEHFAGTFETFELMTQQTFIQNQSVKSFTINAE